MNEDTVANESAADPGCERKKKYANDVVAAPNRRERPGGGKGESGAKIKPNGKLKRRIHD